MGWTSQTLINFKYRIVCASCKNFVRESSFTGFCKDMLSPAYGEILDMNQDWDPNCPCHCYKEVDNKKELFEKLYGENYDSI